MEKEKTKNRTNRVLFLALQTSNQGIGVDTAIKIQSKKKEKRSSNNKGKLQGGDCVVKVTDENACVGVGGGAKICTNYLLPLKFERLEKNNTMLSKYRN